MLGARNEHKCSSPSGGHSVENISPHLLTKMQYREPAHKKKIKSTGFYQIATSRWESNPNTVLKYSGKLARIPGGCNNDTDIENTLSS